MARRKMKLTGFARFLLVMIILAPLAFIGASYYNGEDGIENFKNLFKGKFSTGKTEKVETKEEAKTEEATKPMSEIEVDARIKQLKSELEFKTEQYDKVFQENTDLKTELEAKTKELEEVKKQLEDIKKAVGGLNKE